MGMPAMQGRRWTAAEVRALPEDPSKQFEVVDGDLYVTPSPSLAHQIVAFELAVLLRTYLRAQRLGFAVMAPADVEPDPHSVVQPDVFVIPPTDGRLPRDVVDAGRLLLAVEVLSRSTSRKDRVVKRRLYARMGTEYWIVDHDARVIERWIPSDARPELLSEALTWCPAGASEPLVIDLGAFFEDALDRRL